MTPSALFHAIDTALWAKDPCELEEILIARDDFDDLKAGVKVNGWPIADLSIHFGAPLTADEDGIPGIVKVVVKHLSEVRVEVEV